MGAFWGYFLDFFGVHDPEEERRPTPSWREAERGELSRAVGEPEHAPVVSAAPVPSPRVDRAARP